MSNQDAHTLLSLEGVGKTYRTLAGDFRVLSDVTMSVARGSFTVLTGASGSGKSTLLHLAAGLDTPTAGEVLFLGEPVPRRPAPAARWRAGNIGIVFQFFQLLPTLRAVENVMLPMEFPGRRSPCTGSRGRRERAMELLSLVGMDEYAEKLPSQLSGGEQQRVAIARALANAPLILLADEPTGNLDSANAQTVLDLLVTLARQGTAILMVTHDQVAAGRADECVSIRDGRIV